MREELTLMWQKQLLWEEPHFLALAQELLWSEGKGADGVFPGPDIVPHPRAAIL